MSFKKQHFLVSLGDTAGGIQYLFLIMFRNHFWQCSENQTWCQDLNQNWLHASQESYPFTISLIQQSFIGSLSQYLWPYFRDLFYKIWVFNFYLFSFAFKLWGKELGQGLVVEHLYYRFLVLTQIPGTSKI